MAKVYLAGASAEIETCERWMRELSGVGHEITLDWCTEIRKRQAVGLTDADLTNEERHVFATSDLVGVMSADIFWLLVPENASTGAWVELGAAIGGTAAKGRPGVLFCSGSYRRCLFTALAARCYDTHEEAFEKIRRL